MTKRETIMITALVNAGLLVILFVSALKENTLQEEIALKPKMPVELPAVIAQEAPVRNETKKIVGDEVDLVLRQYREQNPLQAPTQSPVSFVEDLKALGSESPKEQVSFLSEPSKVVSKVEVVESLREVTIKKGDMLEKLAKQHHTTVAEIMKVNHLSSTQLRIGQVLKMPEPRQKEQKETEKKPLDPTSAKYYIVKAGDNLWTIAVKNHLKVEELLQLNELNEEKARKLKPGDRIRIQ